MSEDVQVSAADTGGVPVARGDEIGRIDEKKLDLVLDIPIEITVEIGRRKMLLGEIVRLGPGAILELGKLSGEPLDIMANGHLIARGEAVVVGERYGVRVMSVVSSRDRLGSLTKLGQEEP
jgi:flagellar motor switch protein FliN/FliY